MHISPCLPRLPAPLLQNPILSNKERTDYVIRIWDYLEPTLQLVVCERTSHETMRCIQLTDAALNVLCGDDLLTGSSR
jgi:hypothetical protein